MRKAQVRCTLPGFRKTSSSSQRGQRAYDLWVQYGRSEPLDMGSTRATVWGPAGPLPPGAQAPARPGRHPGARNSPCRAQPSRLRPGQGLINHEYRAYMLTPTSTIPGDFNRVSVEEVDRLAKGDASGRVQR